ncbi:hypothetical protein [Legionella norrlandica]|nr:hypothetical protein [Legionella norrlandica]
MDKMIVLFLFAITNSVYANSITFKKELIATPQWFSYGFVFILLLIILFILARFSPKTKFTPTKCQIIEKLTVHQKTKIYIIEYQSQQFLIADNQAALAVHLLQKDYPS